jgi:hypothetical protein
LSLIIYYGGMEDSKKGKHDTYLSVPEKGSFTADAGSVHSFLEGVSSPVDTCFGTHEEVFQR